MMYVQIKDGVIVARSNVLEVIPKVQGAQLYVSAETYLAEVTNHKKTLEQMRDLQEQYQSLVDSVDNFLSTSDAILGESNGIIK